MEKIITYLIRALKSLFPAKSSRSSNFRALSKSPAAFFLTAALVLAAAPARSPVYAATDEFVLGGPVENTYTGRAEAGTMIRNLSFTDVPGDFWAKDAITRAGALNMVKGYAETFSPGGTVSNEEALAFAVRALGMESQAQAAGAALAAQLPAGSSLREVWSMGYLSLAQAMGLITQAELAEALAADQAALDPAVSFTRGGPAARERVADWLRRALLSVSPGAFPVRTQQGIYTAKDWESVAPERADSVEAFIQYGIMAVDPDGNFRPKGAMTRAEMAQTLKNMDNIYYGAVGIQKKAGTVGGIKDSQFAATGSASLARDVYVRRSDGAVDVLRYALTANASPQSGDTDAVVLKDGAVAGLASLAEGDGIEYLVSAWDGTVLYVQVTGPVLDVTGVRGRLESVDFPGGIITVSSQGKDYAYPMAGGLFGTDGGEWFIRFGSQKVSAAELPVGGLVELRLKNSVADSVAYLGEPDVTAEFYGIVLENNFSLGYMTVIDPIERQIVRKHYADGLKARKKEYYDMSGEAEYIERVFPGYKYDPLETDMSGVVPGDVVFLETAPDDPDRIVGVSAAASCAARYGKILEFHPYGDISSMLVKFENGQTAWYDVADGVFIRKNGARISAEDVQPGDWARLLISQALVGPGRVTESVREMTVEDGGRYISAIVKGRFSGVNAIQNRLVVENAQTLTKAGWGDFAQVKAFDISGPDTEYYSGGRRVSPDYAFRNLKRAGGDVYIALENNYAGEKVRKVTFRDGRDELLNPDTVLRSDGNGAFAVLSSSGPIKADEGSIVVRNGRLIDGRGITASDYATVALNGNNTAAVVQIVPRPDASGIALARGRILSADGGRSFKVQSMAALEGTVWYFTPVRREFAVDRDTVFINSSGAASLDSFIGYTDASVVDRVYTVVADGARASRVVDSPYASNSIRGVVYRNAEGRLSLKDVTFLDAATGKWLAPGGKNPTAEVAVPINSIVVRNNAAVSAAGLRAGDQVRVMTDALTAGPAAGMRVTGYIILVEN